MNLNIECMGTETVQRSNFISYVEYEISVAIYSLSILHLHLHIYSRSLHSFKINIIVILYQMYRNKYYFSFYRDICQFFGNV